MNLNHLRLLLPLLLTVLAGCNSGIEQDRAKALGQWRDWDKPTDPRELEAYLFAHNLKLPDSLPKPVPFDFKAHEQSSWISYIPEYIKNRPFLFITLSDFWGDYRNHIRQIERVSYFDHLCHTEAGETIFKAVDKVEGLYQMRPMPRRTTALMHDRYGFEDPADWNGWESERSPTAFVSSPFRMYDFFESLQSPEQITQAIWRQEWIIHAPDDAAKNYYWRYSNYVQGKQPMVAEPKETIAARYGYTWRGIRRERDREFGIAGGELMVLDLQTNEVLAVRRSFAIAKVYEGGTKLDWEFAYFCPLRRDDSGNPSAVKDDLTYYFVSKVIVPFKHNEK